MIFTQKWHVLATCFALTLFAAVTCVKFSVYAQDLPPLPPPEQGEQGSPIEQEGIERRLVNSASAEAPSLLKKYFDPQQGASVTDLIRRALASNADLAATRLDIERARARLRQAGLRPNPILDFEQTSGRLAGTRGDTASSAGVILPLELFGKRERRIDLARAELEAAEAEFADRERRLAAQVRSAYVDALAALRELQITVDLNDLDAQTARVIQARVTEGESAPLEQNLMNVEVDRLRSRRTLIEGKLEAALLRLKTFAGIPVNEPLRLSEDLSNVSLPPSAGSLDAALEIALRNRPDLRLARLTEEVAQAGLRLARAQGMPDVNLSARYSRDRSLLDDAPIRPFVDKGSSLTFGVSISLPLLNRNQGAREEASASIAQAAQRRLFIEQLVRAEISSAYRRYEAAHAAVATYGQGVISRSSENVRVIREAYGAGAFRITDLIVEQRRFVDSQREFIEALAEQYRALADLQSAMGLPVK